MSAPVTGCTRPSGAALVAAILLLLAPVASAADPDPGRLQEIERDLAQDRSRAAALERDSAALAEEVGRLQREMVAAARAAQDREEEMSELEATVATLEDAASERRSELGTRRLQLSAMAGALQRLALQPPQAMLLGPAAPLDTVRGATLLGAALPAVEGRARALRDELDSLRQLRDEIDARQRELAEAARALDAERDRLAALVREKEQLQAETESERNAVEARMAALGREATDIRDLMARIALTTPPPVPEPKPVQPGEEVAAAIPPPDSPPPASPPAAPQDGAGPEPAALLRLDRPAEIREFPPTEASLVLPARGRIVGRYGEETETGLSRKGIVIATRPAAHIVAPFDGQVMFRGPFRGYGEILILEHVGGYHTLLAGLGRTDAIVGQWLLAGEPVGIMGAAGNGNPELYLELRRDGQPINPLPWLNISDSKIE